MPWSSVVSLVVVHLLTQLRVTVISSTGPLKLNLSLARSLSVSFTQRDSSVSVHVALGLLAFGHERHAVSPLEATFAYIGSPATTV